MKNTKKIKEIVFIMIKNIFKVLYFIHESKFYCVIEQYCEYKAAIFQANN